MTFRTDLRQHGRGRCVCERERVKEKERVENKKNFVGHFSQMNEQILIMKTVFNAHLRNLELLSF